MSGAGEIKTAALAQPKVKVTGFCLVRDAAGRPKLSRHMLENPQDIPGEIKGMMTERELRELGIE